MASGQRAFAQRLSKQSNADVRRQIAAAASVRRNTRGPGNSHVSSAVPLCEVVDPVDFEEFLNQHEEQFERDPIRHLLDFPPDDIYVGILPRKCRTTIPIVPEEDSSNLDQHVKDCIHCYTSDSVIVNRRYQQFSSSGCLRDRTFEKSQIMRSTPKQEFEVDLEEEAALLKPGLKSSPVHQPPLAQDEDSTSDSSSAPSSNRQSLLLGDTPRGSWASSVFDLRNSLSDPLIPSLLSRTPVEEVDHSNEVRRKQNRQEAFFALYPQQEEDTFIERRLPALMPHEHMGHRILVKCLALKLELEMEPFFGSMAIYDAKEKKKVSENFYFDMNPEPLKRMLVDHVPYQDVSSLSRSSIFNITWPSTDLFLVVKLEKVLQGDINECAEPYMKDDKNRDKVQSSAVNACRRLGKYRMPFAWTAIYLMNIVNGVNSLERDSTLERESMGTNSLGRRGSLERKSGSEKRNSWSPDDFGQSLDTFPPVTLTVNSFFKQEGDKLRDEDLYKFLLDLKRPSSVKRLKCIPGTLRLDISPCPDEAKYCLTPELVRLHPYPDEKGRPTKEILEFPAKEVYVPHYVYRNLLYVYPKNLNFTNRPGSARNITCKVQFMSGEDPQSLLPNIFGKSSCPELSSEAMTAVTYHSKNPDFYDEIKIKLPAKLTNQHHLLFTFFHISCRQKADTKDTLIETPIGYTWLPILQNGRLQTGEHSLPVMVDKPPRDYSIRNPSVLIPNTKWVDNHKGLFTLVIEAVSSVYSQDPYIDSFLQVTSSIEEQGSQARGSESSGEEGRFKECLLGVSSAKPEPLVQFLQVVLDKLVKLLVRPPVIGAQVLNISQNAFETMAYIVAKLTNALLHLNDVHGRNSLLASYVQYQCTLPNSEAVAMGTHSSSNLPLVVGLSSPSTGYGSLGRPISLPSQRSYPTRSNSNPDLTSYLDSDTEVGLVMSRGLDRTASLRAPGIQDGFLPGGPVYVTPRSQVRKIVHEELALQWVVSSGEARELALRHAWFFFEMMTKSMSQYVATTDRMQLPRKMRFSQQFVDDITTLVTTITSELISRHMREETDLRFIQSLNRSLAFFLCDLFSIMNRGYVYTLIKTYCKQMSAKISSLPESNHLICLKLDFLRVVCSHEHFVTLNLPFGTPLSPSPPTSPSPSVSSTASSCTSTSTLTDKGNYAELSLDYRQQHFLLGLVLSDLATVLEVNNPNVHMKAINLVRNLLTCHDWDSRFGELDVKARVATLYLPLLFIVMDTLPRLYDWHQENKARSMNTEDIHDTSITSSVAMAIASTNVFTRTSGHDSYDNYHQSSRFQIREDLTRHLLACFLWVIKNVSERTLQHCWAELTYHRLQQVLEVLYICVSCFEYKGKKSLRKLNQTIHRKTSDIKTRLEESILGNLNARTEMMNRRKERHPPSPASPMQSDKLRWRKDQMQWKINADNSERPKMEVETEAHIEGNLATEANLIILDALELIIKVVSSNDSLQGLLSCALRVLLHSFGCNQSTFHLQNMFATQRALVFKFPELLFEEETEQCADLCLRLLRHCSSCISTVRAQASASLYLLMRQNFEIGNNFARVKMQVTMSLSSLVGRSQSFNEGFLRRSLKTILLYAEEDAELLETTFPEQVRDLVFNLYMILSDTVKMKEFQEDPEMLLDLMYRIAKGYQNSPDLRLTWLANMAQKHTEKQNYAEAAMCLVHSAGLVAEYLHMLEDRTYLPVGCVTFEKVSSNVLEESAVSDDILSPDEEGICTGKYFTENGLVGLLEQAAISFSQAGLWEAMNEVYSILMPIAQAHRDYKKLANIHAKLNEAFTKVDQQVGKRVFGTYFRVGFYGSKFGDLDEQEFVYKEPTLTKLPEISSRLECFYTERFGDEFVEMIKDSNAVDPSKLNPEKAYIQITYVEPYFDMYELRDRVTSYEKNYNIRRFIYATPFTSDGRAHGELHEQHKRKTILTTVNTFPYVKTRVQVLERKVLVLTPIEVAIEDIQKKTSELAAATYQEPADPKILQMVLQGCIGTTVNQGPMEVAMVFLYELLDGHKTPTASQNRLRICFKDFLKKCGDALRKNRSLIGPDQRDYQRELDRNYSSFKEKILPMIDCHSMNAIRTVRVWDFETSSQIFIVESGVFFDRREIFWDNVMSHSQIKSVQTKDKSTYLT